MRGSAPRLTPAYFRSVAAALADAAEALQTAHDRGIYHRDLKPSNMMIEPSGKCWLLDFGLASPPPNEPHSPSQSSANADSSLTQNWLGTPAYMAPEQFDRQGDARLWDVWGLGATLYELLTMTPPFVGEADAIRARAQGETPTPPRRINVGIPRDLNAICMKALNRDPAQRYPTARAFAEDVRRWLSGRSVAARPGWLTLRPLRLWAWRNKSKAALICVTVVGICSVWILDQQRTNAENRRLNDSVNHAAERADAAEKLSRAKQRELALVDLQRVRLTERHNGWSKAAWEKAASIAATGQDAAVRDQAAAILAGMDAMKVFDNRFHGASSATFDATGKRLLTGGWSSNDPKFADQPARLWNDWKGRPDDCVKSQHVGSGPVTFDRDGRPLQLVQPTRDRQSLLLWDMDKKQPVAEFPVHVGDREIVRAMALAANGDYIAAVVGPLRGDAKVRIWNVGTQKILGDFTAAVQAVAFSPDGTLLATGDEHGGIVVRSLPTLETLAEMRDGNTFVVTLGFGRHVRRTQRGHGPSALAGWLLAVGGKGGILSVWELESRSAVSHYRGSHFDVRGVAFSPDGTALASVGRVDGHVWDVATGKSLLSIAAFGVDTAVAFSPTERRLCVCAEPAFGVGEASGAQVWDLQSGRGVDTLYGLKGQVAKVVLSPDATQIAALSQDWEVGIWETESGRLLHLFDVPQGGTADNAGMAFNPENTQLAFSTSLRAALYDLTTGKVLHTWELPKSYGDQVAFDATGTPVVFRIESKSAEPTRWLSPPYASRFRRLAGNAAEVIKELDAFDGDFSGSSVSTVGCVFAAAGRARGDGTFTHVLVFDANTGRIIRSIDTKNTRGTSVCLDPLGTFVQYEPDDKLNDMVITEIASGRVVWNRKTARGLDASGSMFACNVDEPYDGMGLFVREESHPFVILNMHSKITSFHHAFSRDGRLLAWGNADGSVSVCDIEQVRRQLAAIGLEIQKSR